MVRDVVVCGEACLGECSDVESDAALALARVAGVELLGVRFGDAGACAATTLPSLERDDTRAALLDHLLRAES